MGVFLVIVIVIVIFVVYSNNKEKERRRKQARHNEAENIKKKYKLGYDAWAADRARFHTFGYYTDDYIVEHKEEIIWRNNEIIKRNNEIAERNKARAHNDILFEKAQKEFTDSCFKLSKNELPDFGRYFYYIDWIKHSSDGNGSEEKFKIWQFFPEAVCLAEDLNYEYRHYEKSNAENIPKYQDMTLKFTDSVYDKINKFISNVANLSSSPLLVVLIDNKRDSRQEQIFQLEQRVYGGGNAKLLLHADSEGRLLPEWSVESIEYHLKPIKRDIENTIVIPISELTADIDTRDSQIVNVIAVDVYTQNHRLANVCNAIKSRLHPSSAAISYISLLKCYEKDEMKAILEKAEEKWKLQELHIDAMVIKEFDSDGYKLWKYSLLQSGVSEDDITNKMIVDAEDRIAKLQLKFENEEKEIIENVKNAVAQWNHLTPDFTYKYLLRYYPVKCEFEATDDEWDDRWIVWNFKNNPAKVSPEKHDEAMTWVIQKTEKMLFETFDKDALKHLTLVCIPASSKSSTERRFKDFSETLCKDTGMDNAYTHITVSQEVVPKSQGGTGLPTLEFDADFFKNKNIIIFDDVITSGRSMLRMKLKMEQLGATVIAGMSIGKTFHHRPDNQNNSSVSPVRSQDFNGDVPFSNCW